MSSRNSLTTRPRYFTSLILSICWPLIVKLRCLVIFARDFCLNKIISVVFSLWLMFLFILFNDLSDRIKLISSAKWWAIREYSSCFMHAIVVCMNLPVFKIFSNFVHFCQNFQIFCLFCPFIEKSHSCPYFLE